jgi:hypothetical protein
MNINNSIMWVDSLSFISGNALPFNTMHGHFSSNQLENIDNNSVMNAFQQVLPGDYKLVRSNGGVDWPMHGVTIKFNKSEDEVLHRLKHG